MYFAHSRNLDNKLLTAFIPLCSTLVYMIRLHEYIRTEVWNIIVHEYSIEITGSLLRGSPGQYSNNTVVQTAYKQHLKYIVKYTVEAHNYMSKKEETESS